MKRYVDEPDSAAVRMALRGQAFATSRLRRTREGGLSSIDLTRVLNALRQDVASIALIEVDEEVTREAIALLARHRLRAGDSIQLASCLSLAYDDRLNDVARAEGLLLSRSM